MAHMDMAHLGMAQRIAPSFNLLLFSTGVISHRFTDQLVQESLALCLLLLALLLATRLHVARLLLCFIMGFSWANHVAAGVMAQRLAPGLEKQDVILEGHICTIPRISIRHVGFDFCVDALFYNGNQRAHPNKVRLKSYQDQPFYQAGQQWRLVVRMKRARGLQNPGSSFDYETYLFANRIGATGYVREDARNQLIPAKNEAFPVTALRQSISTFIATRLHDHPHNGILTALLVGLRGNMDRLAWEILKNTGTIHLVAISGLHIGLVSGLLAWLTGWLWRLTGTLQNRIPASTVAVGFALAGGLGYALLAGMAIPTRRALVMLVVVCFAVIARSRPSPLEILNLALFAVLLFDPLSALDSGFWLSFYAVAIILIFLPRLRAPPGQPPISRFVRLPASWLSMQLALGVGMGPLVVLLFNQVSIISPLANLLAVPVISLAVVPVGLIGLIMFLAGSESAALWFFEFALVIFSYLWEVLEYLGTLSWSAWKPSNVPGPVLLAPLAGMATWLIRPLRFRTLVCAAWFVPLLVFQPQKVEPGHFTYTMLDVGQGLAGVVETRNHVLVYDTGPAYPGGFDAGESVVVPYLRSRGLDRIDILLISHQHNDHAGGFGAVRRVFEPAKILSGVPSQIPGSIKCRAGQVWQWDGVTFEVLWPNSSADNDGYVHGNNASCVIRVSGGENSLLLTGDIEAEVEKALVQRYPGQLRSTVLQVPHQGSRTSSTWQFLKQVQPRFALISAGYLNRFGHPHPDIVARYKVLEVTHANTAHRGAITVTWSPRLRVWRYRDNLRGYWYN